jgi:gamma-glutamyltranspeptidase / glutathione hydrolase
MRQVRNLSGGFMRPSAFLALPLLFAPLAASAQISADALDQSGAAAAWRTAKPVVARHAMVATAQHEATQVGVRILKAGGNAVDAAVAIGYAEAVVHPCCGNIGGGGFMMIHLAGGKNLFLDFREKAPEKATATLFQDASGKVIPDMSTKSWKSAGVPGTVMGLNEALAKYGTMPLGKVIAPAIALARDGFVLTDGDVKILNNGTRMFQQETNVAPIFLNNGRPYAAGERLVQADLARSLEAIAKGGTAAFYKGDIAKKVVAASDANGGLFTMKDFADYTVKWDEPVRCDYRGYQVVSSPPPSSGGVTVCEILQTLSAYPLAKWGYGSVQATHYIVEAERRAYADRNVELGDPAFVTNPIRRLTSAEHAAQLRATIKPDRATPSSEVRAGDAGAPEETETTHYSVVDAKGNAVSVTYTINFLFGNGKIAGDTGFFLNDEMDDFTSKPGVPNGFGLVQGKANAIAGGKRPLSSMSPTILLKNGKPFMVTGSPGGSTIITSVLQSILNVVDFRMNMQQAVNAPRFHHQWLPDDVVVEAGYLTPQSQAKLEAMGYSFRENAPWGALDSILIDPKTGQRQGANDGRRTAGLAAGY